MEQKISSVAATLGTQPKAGEIYLLRPEYVRELIQNAENEYANQGSISGPNIKALNLIAMYCLDSLILEKEKEKLHFLLKTLVQMYVLPGNPIDDEVYNYFMAMDWSRWGAEDSSIQKIREGEIVQIIDLITEKANLISEEIFKYYNLNPKDMMYAWRNSIFPVSIDMGMTHLEQKRFIFKNFSRLKEIELKRPGIAPLLAKEFGVKVFGRYPPEMLIEQYDTREDLETPYGIILTGMKDYSGFLDISNNSGLKNLAKKFKDKCRIRVVESGRNFNLLSSLARLDKRYGKKRKISFAILRAHGNPDEFWFGPWTGSAVKREANKISVGGIREANKDTLERIRGFFTKGATIVLDSCGSGLEEGIASEISEGLKINVIAPSGNSYGIDSIVTQDKGDGELDFFVTYTDKDGDERPATEYFAHQ